MTSPLLKEMEILTRSPVLMVVLWCAPMLFALALNYLTYSQLQVPLQVIATAVQAQTTETQKLYNRLEDRFLTEGKR